MKNLKTTSYDYVYISFQLGFTCKHGVLSTQVSYFSFFYHPVLPSVNLFVKWFVVNILLIKKHWKFSFPTRLLMTWGCVMILTKACLGKCNVTGRKSVKFVLIHISLIKKVDSSFLNTDFLWHIRVSRSWPKVSCTSSRSL